MNWLAMFFYTLAAVETFMFLITAAHFLEPVRKLTALRLAFLCLVWPALPAIFLYKMAFNK